MPPARPVVAYACCYQEASPRTLPTDSIVPPAVQRSFDRTNARERTRLPEHRLAVAATIDPTGEKDLIANGGRRKISTRLRQLHRGPERRPVVGRSVVEPKLGQRWHGQDKMNFLMAKHYLTVRQGNAFKKCKQLPGRSTNPVTAVFNTERKLWVKGATSGCPFTPSAIMHRAVTICNRAAQR